MAYFGQYISTKSDPFVRSITNLRISKQYLYMLGAYIITRSSFQQWSKRGFARFNELLKFSGSSLQATCGYLLVQASYSQSDQFYKQRSDKLSRLQRATPVVVVVVYRTLTDPLRIQPWSQDRRNQTNQTGNTFGDKQGKQTEENGQESSQQRTSSR